MASFAVSVGVAGLLAGGGFAKGSLSVSGAVAALFVGAATLMSSWRCGAALVLFFVSSSAATRLGAKRKKEVEGAAWRPGGNRTWVQVLSNAPATVLCVAMLMMTQGERGRLERAHLAQMAAMQGDTWSSEIGVLAKRSPVLLTQFRTVPPGTNGAVSVNGFAGAFLGGALMGVFLSVTELLVSGVFRFDLIISSIFWALFGSVLDSILGATLQYSGFDKKNKCVVEHPGPDVEHICGRNILDNHQINLLTSVVITIVAIIFG